MFNRRETILTGLGAAALGARASAAAPATASPLPATSPTWRRGPDNQRIADRGDGFYLNPIFAGDHPDPTILKDGADYYMTFSTFDSYPGLVIWHSRDLVNWQPVTAALKTFIGSVWAPELCKHQGRYYLYIPTKDPTTSWVIWADRIEGPWSEPIDLKLPHHIDPGHAVDEHGARWLFLSGGDRIRLAPDGLSTVGAPNMSMIPGIIRTIGTSRASRPKAPRCCATAPISISSPPSAARPGHRPAIW
jgi:xylan 1,4-beta-xylosidase